MAAGRSSEVEKPAREVVITRVFDAPRRLVFDVWTQPEHVVRWWGPRGYTVINYDRRGRGQSTDTPPYAVEREVEDLEALSMPAGGSAYLFGSSSGSVSPWRRQASSAARSTASSWIEPPGSSSTTAARPCRRTWPSRSTSWWRPAGAAMRSSSSSPGRWGFPACSSHVMRWLMPGWAKMAAVAHTLRYDLAVGWNASRQALAGRAMGLGPGPDPGHGRRQE